MAHTHHRHRRRATLAVAAILLWSLVTASAGAHSVRYFWKYEPRLFQGTHGWKKHADIRARHGSWHREHPKPKRGRAVWRKRHLAFHHRVVDHLHQGAHYHDVIRSQTGKASWYDMEGETGACGAPLQGLYAAHRRWKCGSLVSVRAGDRHVFVRILDRGPFVDGRVIDLSKEAFSRIEDPDRGVTAVEIYQLAP